MNRFKYSYALLFFIVFSFIFLMQGLFISGPIQCWIDKWQQLIVGLLALIFPYVVWQNQILDQRNHKTALRAKLGMAVSDLCSYARGAYNYMDKDLTDLPSRDKANEAINCIAENIKFSDEETAKSLANLIECFQTHHARLDSYAQNQAINKKDESIPNPVELYALSSSFFDYARFKSDTVPEFNYIQDKLVSALRGCMRDEWHTDEEKYKRYLGIIILKLKQKREIQEAGKV